MIECEWKRHVGSWAVSSVDHSFTYRSLCLRAHLRSFTLSLARPRPPELTGIKRVDFLKLLSKLSCSLSKSPVTQWNTVLVPRLTLLTLHYKTGSMPNDRAETIQAGLDYPEWEPVFGCESFLSNQLFRLKRDFRYLKIEHSFPSDAFASSWPWKKGENKDLKGKEGNTEKKVENKGKKDADFNFNLGVSSHLHIFWSKKSARDILFSMISLFT